MMTWSAGGPRGPGLRELGLGLGHGDWMCSGATPAWFGATGSLAALREGCGVPLSLVHGDAAGTCSVTLRWRLVTAATDSEDFHLDGAARDGPVELLRPLMQWYSSFVMQVLYLHMKMGMFDPYLYFFARSDDVHRYGRVSEIHGMNELFAAIMCHLLHLHPNYEDTTNLMMISFCGYANFDFHYLWVEIIYSGYWSIAFAAQSLDCLNWDQLSCVHLHVQTLELSVKGSPIDPYEQISPTCLCCIRLCLLDDTTVEDIVPLLFGLCHRRWTVAPSLLILRFNRGDTLRLSSVKAIDIYSSTLTNLKCIRQIDRWESHPRGINWYGAQRRPLKIALAASSSLGCRRTNDRCLTPIVIFCIFYANLVHLKYVLCSSSTAGFCSVSFVTLYCDRQC